MYVYAFIKSQSYSIKSLTGISEPVTLVDAGGLSAVVELNLQAEHLPQTSNEEQLMQAVLTHDRIVCQIFKETTILPLRFGTCFDSEARLLQHMKNHEDHYCQQLEKLMGRGEYLLQGTPRTFSENTQPTETSPKPVKGRDYFLQKKRLHHQRLNLKEQQEKQWQDLIDAIVRIHPIVHGKPHQQSERIYILMPRNQELTLIQWLNEQQKKIDLWELNLGNALPAYHFL